MLTPRINLEPALVSGPIMACSRDLGFSSDWLSYQYDPRRGSRVVVGYGRHQWMPE